MITSPPDARSTHVNGRLRGILQAGSLALVVGLLVPFVASLPLRWRQLLTSVSAADAPGISGLPFLDVVYLSRLGRAEVDALRVRQYFEVAKIARVGPAGSDAVVATAA